MPYYRACGYPSMAPVVETEACLCPRYPKKSTNDKKTVNQPIKINWEKSKKEKKSPKKKKARGLSAPKKKKKKKKGRFLHIIVLNI